jgi:hypothetical protein
MRGVVRRIRTRRRLRIQSRVSRCRRWGNPTNAKMIGMERRLQITGIEPGRYNVKLADKIGRNCVVTNIEEGGCGLLNRGTTEGLRMPPPGKGPAAH